MIAVTPNTKVVAVVRPVDFRKGIDGLLSVSVISWTGVEL